MHPLNVKLVRDLSRMKGQTIAVALGSLILDLPGLKEPADGLILSLPEDRPQQLNLLFFAERPASRTRQQ
jgi:hypothetical protein